jgi:hypothetical protein
MASQAWVPDWFCSRVPELTNEATGPFIYVLSPDPATEHEPTPAQRTASPALLKSAKVTPGRPGVWVVSVDGPTRPVSAPAYDFRVIAGMEAC